MKHNILHISVITTIIILFVISPQIYAKQDKSEPNDLFDLSLEELLEVEVTVASKKSETIFEAPGIINVVQKDEIETYGDRTLLQLMQRQPSVYTYNSFCYPDNQASFRGGLSTHSETHTLILLNGRPVRESSQGHNFPLYDTFPLSALDSVEIIRGPGSVLYGTNAFTGVVNLKVKVPEQNKYSISTMAGSYDYYEAGALASGKSGNLGYLTAFRAAGQQGYPYSMTDMLGTYGKDNKHEKSVSGVAHLEYRDLTFDIFASDMEMFHMGVMPFWSIPGHELRNKRLFTNLGYYVPIDDRMYIEMNGTLNLQENVLSSPTGVPIGNNIADTLGEITLFANPFENFNTVVGYVQEYRTTYKPDEDHFQSIPDYHYAPMSIYAQGDYTIGNSLKLIAGTQWNKSSQGDAAFTSRYGIIYTPFENWGIKLLRGEAFRGAVTMESDLSDPILTGNKNLKPETITTYDAQLFYHDKKTYAAITYFTSRIDDQILFDNPPTTYTNGGSQRFDGIEFEAKRFLTPNWHVLGSFMYQKNKSEEGVDPTVVPNEMFKFGTAYTWNWGTIAMFYTFFGKPPTTDFPTTLQANPKPEAINLVNLNMNIDLSDRFGLPKGMSIFTFKVENLFNEKIFVPTLAYSGSPNTLPYNAGTTFYAGLKINF